MHRTSRKAARHDEAKDLTAGGVSGFDDDAIVAPVGRRQRDIGADVSGGAPGGAVDVSPAGFDELSGMRHRPYTRADEVVSRPGFFGQDQPVARIRKIRAGSADQRPDDRSRDASVYVLQIGRPGDIGGGLSVAFRSPHGLAETGEHLKVGALHDGAEIARVVRGGNVDVCVETRSRYSGLRGRRQVGVVLVGADNLRG